jgi:hypothetical protein
MGQRISYPGFVGAFVRKEDELLAKYLAKRQGVSVSELIRQWLQAEATKPLVGPREPEHAQD